MLGPTKRRIATAATCAALGVTLVAAAPAATAASEDERGAQPSRNQRGAAYANPMGSRPVTAAFGERGSWWLHGSHDGIDYDAAEGDAVDNACTGVVLFAGNRGTWAGKHVVVRCVDGVELTYAHLSRINVSKGARVTVDSRLGAVGHTGNTTGSHLHIGAELNGRSVNPSKYIPR